MGDIQVMPVSIENLLEKLREGEWLVPQFQREFVWSTADVEQLVWSILSARPIGMATLWEQSDTSGLALDHINLPDSSTKSSPDELVHFGEPDKKANRHFAILDGRQRSTAIAMAFGGLRPEHGARKYAGHFYLNLKDDATVRPVVFKKLSEITREGIGGLRGAIAQQGLMPLAPPDDEGLFSYWFRAIQAVSAPDTYDSLPDSERPTEAIREQRRVWIEDCFQALNRTRLAIYVVPPEYDLSEICEIFETLNTTGTRVSTVDLIHSWLFAETQHWDDPILLRDSIDEIGSRSGAEGWSSRDDRPELIAQIVTACHVAAEKKHPPRLVSGRTSPITSVKAGDLLGTPELHWSEAIDPSTPLATWLGDFQKVVVDGRFTHRQCPYPVSAGIYIALRWHQYFDKQVSHPWSVADADGLFRAFFWRNALATRYDQGFLTQLGTDIKSLKAILNSRPEYPRDKEWIGFAEEGLAEIFASVALPTRDDLIELLTTGSLRGALQRALMLPVIADASRDLLNPSVKLGIPDGVDRDLHHIIPKAWIRNNASKAVMDALIDHDAGSGWVNSIANLMPLSAESNRKWKAKRPGVALEEAGLTLGTRSELLDSVYIDQESYELLTAEYSETFSEVKEFWLARAARIADRLLELQRVAVH